MVMTISSLERARSISPRFWLVRRIRQTTPPSCNACLSSHHLQAEIPSRTSYGSARDTLYGLEIWKLFNVLPSSTANCSEGMRMRLL